MLDGSNASLSDDWNSISEALFESLANQEFDYDDADDYEKQLEKRLDDFRYDLKKGYLDFSDNELFYALWEFYDNQVFKLQKLINDAHKHKNVSDNIINQWVNRLKTLQHNLDVVNGFFDEVSGEPKNGLTLHFDEVKHHGNIYNVAIPDYDVLLNYDDDISTQSVHVRNAVEKIKTYIKRLAAFADLDTYKIDNATSGAEFYWGVVDVFAQYLNPPAASNAKYKSRNIIRFLINDKWHEISYSGNHSVHDGVDRADKRASLLFNRFGVPGLFYWDKQSRKKKSGTHNFVIWNNDFINILAISPDSDKDAIDYFNNTRNEQALSNGENFNQIIGEFGARILDGYEGLTSRIDNLHVAQSMLKAGKDPNAIRFATGWELGTDNKWKFEILDGELINNHGKNNIRLQDFYSSEELYKAYPFLRDVTVAFDIDVMKSLRESGLLKGGGWDKENNTIHLRDIDRNILNHIDPSLKNKYDRKEYDSLRKMLIHEIQHAIQNFEGFAVGSNSAFIRKILREHPSPYGHFNPDDVYLRSAGEVEARNAAKRSELSDYQRRNSLLADSEDVPRDRQIAFRDTSELYSDHINARDEEYYHDYLDSLDNDSDVLDYSSDDYASDMAHIDDIANAHSDALDNSPDSQSYSQAHIFSPQQLEQFNQLAYTGTGNIIRGNKFDLKFIGSNEGGAMFGYGAYLAENKEVSEHYRHYSSSQEDNPTIPITIFLNDGRKFSFNDVDFNPDLKPVRDAMFQLSLFFDENPNATNQQAISEVREWMNSIIQRNQNRKTNEAKLFTRKILKSLDVLNSIQRIQRFKRNGNIYLFDIPENHELLDWDAPLDSQPQKVKHAINLIFKALHDLGYSNDKIHDLARFNGNIETGGEFYQAVVSIMQDWLNNHPNPDDGITRPDARTSLLFNQFGIPGLRYWDSYSRELQKGTHNFVIWDTDRMNMLGLTNDSDHDAIEHFNEYKRSHPDGFIDNHAVELFNQIHLHATGHIIFNNQFDLNFIGSGEGGSAYGHGIYFAESPNVSQTYRRYGLKNGGLGDIHITTKDGSTFNNSDYHVWDHSPNDNVLDVLLDLEDHIRFNSHYSKKSHLHELKRNLVLSLKSQLQTLLEGISDGKKYISALKKGSEEFSDLQDTILTAQNNADVLKDKIRFLKSIKSFSLDPDRNGNIYNVDIPENHELLDWDAHLNEQSADVRKKLLNTIDIINHHPEALIAFRFSPFDSQHKNALNSLAALSKRILSRFNGHFLNEYEFRNLPEFKQAKRILHDDNILDDFRLALNSVNTSHLTIHEANTGSDLYWALADFLHSKEAASRWLNNQGIPGHRYWDAGSRDTGNGTHNFVIWDLSKVKIVGIDPSSDRDAIDYFYRTRDELNKNQQNSETSESFNQTRNEKDIYDAAHDNYYQHNPFVSRYAFNNPDSEAQFSEAQNVFSRDNSPKGLKHHLLQAIHGFKGDFPQLATAQAKDKGLTYAREILRMLKRKSDAQTTMAVHSLTRSLDKLDRNQFDIFTRLLLINDIYNFKRQNPNAALPLGFTPDALKNERVRFSNLAQNDADVMNAIRSEHALNSHIRNQLADFANDLGLMKLANRIKNNHFDSAMIDYAHIISHNSPDINANYIHAMGQIRILQLQDIERLKAVKEIKEHYDIKDKLVNKFGKDWKLHIPNGYKSWNILSRNFIASAQSMHENILSSALELTAQQLGLSDDTLNYIRQTLNENDDAHLLVLPNELVNSIQSMLKTNHRGPIAQFLKNISTGWKKLMLFFPTRTVKYNIRNITGDLDAVLAGNPKAIRFTKQAISELYTAFYGDDKDISPELLEFQKRGGALTAESAQELQDYRKMKEFKNLISKIDDKKQSSWTSLPSKFWEMTDKLLWSGVQKASNFREGWLRYACYLEYLDQMQKNDDGLPDNFGASDPDEVISVPDFRDRAFKISNELLGAYDQVSETGQALRDLLIPFYSWLEVNATRYLQLLKNGVTFDNPKDFIADFIKSTGFKSPIYAYRIGKTLLMVNLLALLVKAFNHLVWPDDEDKLPPDVKERPHITLGHDPITGEVLYFDRIGALTDNLEWFAGDTFASDIKAILDGKISVSDWVLKVCAAPINKIVQGITPLIKTPFELATGKSLYPDFTNPRNINDRLRYIAQSFGLSWPYKVAAGEPRSDWDEFKNLFVYSSDADEAAYFYSLGLVRQFKENVLGKRSGGFSMTKRSMALQNLKRALRLDDKEAIKRHLQEYYELGGNNKGLKSSVKNMNPLHSLSKREQAQFLKWISDNDKKYLQRANKFFHTLINRLYR